MEQYLETFHHEFDSNFSTNCDFKVAKILANDRLSTYLMQEMALLNKNATPKYYLGSPLAYSALRQIVKPETVVTDANLNNPVGESIVDRNSVSGIPLVISSNVFTTSLSGDYYGGMVLGSFENYIVAQWGNIDLIVDTTSQAINGCVRLVVNAYFDAALKRPTVTPFLVTTAPSPEKKTTGKEVK